MTHLSIVYIVLTMPYKHFNIKSNEQMTIEIELTGTAQQKPTYIFNLEVLDRTPMGPSTQSSRRQEIILLLFFCTPTRHIWHKGCLFYLFFVVLEPNLF